MNTLPERQSPALQLWAQYHTVGPYGYADSEGEAITDIGADVAKQVCNRPDQLADICWVDFSLFIGERPYRIGESIIATSQRRLREVSFKPVSVVLESGTLTEHASAWISHLILGKEKPASVPDRFDELVKLLYV